MKELPLNLSDMRRDEYWILATLYSLLLPLHILNTVTIVGNVKAFYIPVALIVLYNLCHFRSLFEGNVLKKMALIGCLAIIPLFVYGAPISYFFTYVLTFFTVLGLPTFPKKHIYFLSPFFFLIANILAYRLSLWPGLPWRYQGLYNDPNYYVVSLIVGIYLSIKCIEKNDNTIVRIGAIVSILYSLYIILLTQSRGGLIALLLFGIIYVPTLYNIYPKVTIMGLLILVASSGSIYMGLQETFDRISDRFSGVNESDVHGANTRIYELETVANGIKENPSYLIFGSGLGSTGARTAIYENEHRIHNTAVALIYEQGLIALFVFISLFSGLCTDTYYRDKLSCALVIALTIQGLTIWLMVYLPFWIGYLLTLDYTDEEDEESEEVNELNEIYE